MIKENIIRLGERVIAICQRLGRSSGDITFVGVTKYAQPEAIVEAINAGLTNIGENRVQEAKRKFDLLDFGSKAITRHMIGHLQVNKVKQAVEIFDMIQSVDGLKLALEIQKQCEKCSKTMDVLVQVNTSGEKQKFGMTKFETLALIGEVIKLENIRVLGLMTIAPLTQAEAIIRSCFRSLKELFDEAQKRFPKICRFEMKYLSMGMTNDFSIAIEEGANMIRIGRAVFES